MRVLLKALLPYWHDIIFNSTHCTENEIEHNFWNLINIDIHIEYIIWRDPSFTNERMSSFLFSFFFFFLQVICNVWSSISTHERVAMGDTRLAYRLLVIGGSCFLIYILLPMTWFLSIAPLYIRYRHHWLKLYQFPLKECTIH
jgi:hypothetical protein